MVVHHTCLSVRSRVGTFGAHQAHVLLDCAAMHTSLLHQRINVPALAMQHGQCSTSSRSGDPRHSPATRRSTSTSSCVRAIPPNTFEPHLDSGVLASQLLVLAVTCGGALYWWLELVPNARRRLAKEKRQGEVREMLEQIQRQPDSRRLERWFYSDWLQQLERRHRMARRAAQKQASADTADAVSSSTSAATATQSADVAGQESVKQVPEEQDPANSSTRRSAQDGSSSGQPSQHDDGMDEHERMPSFWSLDNPLIAVGALLGIAIMRTVVFHQGSS